MQTTKCYLSDELPPELVILFAPYLSTRSLNALTQACRRLNRILQPELEARITTEIGKQILLWAAVKSKPHIVSKLLSSPHSINPSEASGYGSGGLRPLHAAVQAGNIEIVALLLNGGADPRSVLGTDNFQPLHLAVFNNRVDIVKLLLDHGAPVREPYGFKVPETSLHYACSVGNVEMVRLLLERGADTECAGEYGTALGYALRARHLDVVDILLKHGAKAEALVPLNGGWLRDGYGPTPPHRSSLLYLAMGLTHPRGEDSPEPPTTEGRRELMAMLLAHGASKEGAMKTVSGYLVPLAEAVDKTEEEFMEMVEGIFADAEFAVANLQRPTG